MSLIQNDRTNIERPSLITGACIIAWLFTSLELLVFIIEPEAANYTIAMHHMYFHWLILGTDLLFIIAFLGIWYMKLWGLILFVLVTILYLSIGDILSRTGLDFTALIINIIIFAMLLPHLKDFG